MAFSHTAPLPGADFPWGHSGSSSHVPRSPVGRSVTMTQRFELALHVVERR